MQLWLGSVLQAMEKSNRIGRKITRRHVFGEQTALGDFWVRWQARNCLCLTRWNRCTKKERVQFNKGERANIRNLKEQQQDKCEVSRRKPCWERRQLGGYRAGEEETSHLKCYWQHGSSKIHNTSPADFKDAEIDKKTKLRSQNWQKRSMTSNKQMNKGPGEQCR